MKKLIYTVLIVAGLTALISSCSKESLDPSMAQDKIVEGSITKAEDVAGLLYGAYRQNDSDILLWT